VSECGTEGKGWGIFSGVAGVVVHNSAFKFRIASFYAIVFCFCFILPWLDSIQFDLI